MKFYRGTPFTDHNLIDENSINQGEAYFIKEKQKIPSLEMHTKGS